MIKKKGVEKVEKVMREYKENKLHSGSKTGPVVKDRRQAVAISLSEAGKSKNK
jgi:ribosomal protein L21E